MLDERDDLLQGLVLVRNLPRTSSLVSFSEDETSYFLLRSHNLYSLRKHKLNGDRDLDTDTDMSIDMNMNMSIFTYVYFNMYMNRYMDINCKSLLMW
jgi:hypothetical protein